MSHRYRLRPSTRQRITFKQVMLISSAISIALTVALVTIINFSKQEDSFAENTMVFETADVIQDTTPVFRGAINQPVIGVQVKTSGSANPIKLLTITFSAKGTTLPVAKNIENARLWFTGKENNFMTSQQVGQTLMQVTESLFEIAVNRELAAGKNYFWLTFDVKPDATTKTAAIDAQCIKLNIGATSLIPKNSAPKGKKNILPNASYFSTGIPYLHRPEAWNSKRDKSGLAPQKMDDPGKNYFIQSGHKLVNTQETYLANITIEKNGTLKAKEVLKTKNLIISDGGIYQQDFSITESNPIENLRMDNGANYIHTNDGKLPGRKKYFSPNSNQCLYQYSAFTFAESVDWGNLVFNSTIAADMDVSNVFRNVKGNLEIQRTGNTHYLFTGMTDTINIGGSLLFSGGRFIGPSGNNNSLIINIGKDLIIKDGMFTDADGSKNANTVVNLSGDVLILGGQFDFTKCPEKLSQINFCDVKTKTVYWSQKAGKINLGHVNILPGKELVIKNGKLGEINTGCMLTVNSGAKLMCAQFPVTGNGKFILKENATLGIGSVKGINSQTPEGNIQTSEKYFDSRANYYYYTGCTPQITGIFTTSPDDGKIKNLTVRKEKPSDYVILSQNIEVTDRALVTLGQLEQGKNKLNISKTSDIVNVDNSN